MKEKQTRSRKSETAGCDDQIESKDCVKKECPKCEYEAKWGEYSKCDCKSGKKVRSRDPTSESPKHCKPETEEEECRCDPAEECKYKEWGEWEPSCCKDISNDKQKRAREVEKGGDSCKETSEERTCEKECDPNAVQCEFDGDWSEWTECECGKKDQKTTRTRKRKEKKSEERKREDSKDDSKDEEKCAPIEQEKDCEFKECTKTNEVCEAVGIPSEVCDDVKDKNNCFRYQSMVSAAVCSLHTRCVDSDGKELSDKASKINKIRCTQFSVGVSDLAAAWKAARKVDATAAAEKKDGQFIITVPLRKEDTPESVVEKAKDNGLSEVELIVSSDTEGDSSSCLAMASTVVIGAGLMNL